MKTYRCQCGAWTGERCQWTGPLSELVIVEYMPECWRESHRAAGNVGRYPHNGALRVAAEASCARLQVADDPEWSRIVRPAREADALEEVDDEPERPPRHVYGHDPDPGF